MGLLERLDELDRRAGLSGAEPRPTTAAGWVLAGLLVASGVGVLVASTVAQGVVRTGITLAGILAVSAWMRRAGSRGGREGPIRAATFGFVVALALVLPAAFLGFWQGPLIVLVFAAITLTVLIRTGRE